VTGRWPRSTGPARSTGPDAIDRWIAEHQPPPTWQAAFDAWCAAGHAWCEEHGLDPGEFSAHIPDEPFDPEHSI
jgi:hypothetical protein